jgi:hypothetical protein
MKRLTLFSSVILSMLARHGVTAVIYDTGPFTSDGGAMASDFSSADGRSAFLAPVQRADDFSIQDSSQITSLNWWGQYAFENTPQGPDDFTVRIFADASGSPSASPLFQFSLGNLGRIDTGIDSFGGDVYAYSAVLPSPVVLAGGTTYWLSIVNNTAADADDNWYWQRVTRSSGAVQKRDNDLSPWLSGESDSGVLAFDLQGIVVPEPSAWALLLLGGASLAFTARKRKL